MPGRARRAILAGMNLRILTLAAFLAAPAAAQKPFPGPLTAPAAKPAGAGSENFRISFKIRSRGLESSGNFVVRDGAQGNYVRGGEDPYEFDAGKGRGVDFKKHGTIVNCAPASAGGAVSMSCQFELSGVLPPAGSLGARPVETFQFQSDFTLRRGETLVLIDEPDRGIEVAVDVARPRAAKP